MGLADRPSEKQLRELAEAVAAVPRSRRRARLAQLQQQRPVGLSPDGDRQRADAKTGDLARPRPELERAKLVAAGVAADEIARRRLGVAAVPR